MIKLISLIIIGLLHAVVISSCTREETPGISREMKRAVIDSTIKANPATDSLILLARHYRQTNNVKGIMLVNKELGKRYRDNARFDEAIKHHREELQSATLYGDTLEIIQALNNLGTDFRRMGILDEASTYHYKALLLCEQYSDKESYTARKNRVVSLNGIGNIHLTLENKDEADSTFRAALAGERELGSNLGQAINYANLGAILEMRGMTDSALVYYRYSMEYNRLAGSDLGISLCYNHFGRLFEQKGNWEDAIREYRNSYDIMEKSSDRWHWMESCLSLARVNISKGDLYEAETYLKRAEKTAEQMRSWEHLSEVYRLNYMCYYKQGDCRRALDSYIKSRAYADSVKNAGNEKHVQNLRVNYEKEKKSREMMLIRQNYETEQRVKKISLITGILLLSLMIIITGFLYYALRMKSRNQKVMRHMEKIRNNFFTNVTHEFRTPLTIILELSERLQKNQISKEEKDDGLEIISRQGKNLLELVNQLLDVSRVKSEVGDPQWRTGDSVAYIRMIMENYLIYARQKHIHLRFIPAETTIVTDFVPEYFRKIMRNLLFNAIKFTPRGGTITVTMGREKQMLVIRVTDTGTGISATDLPNIFDTFYQGENSGAKDIGSGIGLSLVKQMTESMDGTVSAKNNPGEGAEFTVKVPLKHGETILQKWIPDEKAGNKAAAPEADNLPEQNRQEEENGDSIHPSILIVEDNADVSYYIGELLKKNYRLLYARNGAEGLEKAEEQMPDLIITDLMMPEMDGYQLCRRIRGSQILNHIPIIIITAKSEETDRIHGLEAGADAYLQKPFNTDELNTRISKLLEQRRILREKYSSALHEGTEQTVKLNLSDREFLNKLNDLIYSQMTNRNLNSDMIADKMCMSRSQLNRKVRTITGYSTSAYILQMKLEKSKRMLASTEELIADIAFKCGFEDANYFARLFKQIFNMTPTQYRKTLK